MRHNIQIHLNCLPYLIGKIIWLLTSTDGKWVRETKLWSDLAEFRALLESSQQNLMTLTLEGIGLNFNFSSLYCSSRYKIIFSSKLLEIKSTGFHIYTSDFRSVKMVDIIHGIFVDSSEWNGSILLCWYKITVRQIHTNTRLWWFVTALLQSLKMKKNITHFDDHECWVEYHRFVSVEF